MWRSWFKISTSDGQSSLEAKKGFRGALEVTVKYQGEWTTIRLSRENVDHMISWLLRQYPAKGAGNVTGLEKAFSLREAKRDPDGDT